MVACKPDFTILDERIPEPLDNINNPLRYSDAAYEVISRELNIAQDIDVPLPTVPDHLATQNTVREFTPTQMRRAVLGRVLFYDTRLSATGETSCSSCHSQAAAFGDPKRFSQGIRGGHTTRNSFALGGDPLFLTASSAPISASRGVLLPTGTRQSGSGNRRFFLGWAGKQHHRTGAGDDGQSD